MKSIYSKITKCRICDDKNLVTITKLGVFSLTGTFLKKSTDKIHNTPIDIVFSKKSQLLQLKHNYNQKNLFGDNYGYRSGLNKSMKSHLKIKSKILLEKYPLFRGDKILDIGSNDGTFLNYFPKNLKKVGVDPTAKKFKKYYSRNIKIIPKIFKKNTLKNYGNNFKFISAIAMFYDLQNPKLFIQNVKNYLHEDGIFHVEIAYLPDILKKNSFDTFCQEHLTYFSFTSFKYLIDQTSFKIIDFEKNSINGGSINFDLALKNSKVKPKIIKIKKILNIEKKLKLDRVSTYKNYFNKIKNNSKKINNLILKLNKKNKKVYALGASTKGNVILQLCNLNYKNIKAIYDINKFKFKKYTPRSKILIKNEKEIFKDKPDYLFILIWHFSNTLKEKIKKFKKLKMIFIWPFPKLIVRKY